ncbi:sterol desaturase family protein [Aureisphaera sp. CAU 1614]|uniref:Sterol desaturase family protein n=1 Tax=Halomarinibacterium sedimenti TaxID=2857106 RepID=A0A9X1FKY9_9FLAO|nr:sterol desaturase family protein [Halomarinibacterium sedimenti]MBW2936581.1 sterol desaturase family protein [Halomarinibacterium sedimenti]
MEFLDTLLGIDPNYIIIGLIAFFFSLEQLSKSPFNFTKRINHLFQNLLFQITLVILNIFFVTFQVFSIEWFNANHIGLLYVIELPFWVKLGLSVALYDITAYWIHRGTHKIPLLWRFHRVHHSDTTMDASTVFRFHPLEILLVFGIGNILTAALFGTDVLSLALYYFILYLFFFFEHANLTYPKWLNTTLGLLFVMPDQHRVHHQQDQFYTDSNFADIFIIWDRLFGTYKEMPVAQMKYGLKEFDEEKKQTFLYLMKSPFLTIKRIETSKTNPSKPENIT